MENKKVTKREYYGMILGMAEVQERQDLVDFINHEISLLDKKASVKKPTKIQIENENIKEIIVETLVNLNKAVSISEMQEASEELANLSNQKISALLTQLVKNGKVARVEDKRKALFKVIG
jgi:hypothetical protein